MLAVARIGAIHSVVFGGFSADSLRVAHRRRRGQARHHRRRRLPQGQGLPAQARRRRGARRPQRLGRAGDGRARAGRRAAASNDVEWTEGRDLWWHDVVAAGVRPSTRRRRSRRENPLFILYTSGTTGKPKGILHTSGGYLTQAAFTQQGRVRPAPRDRRLLVHGRHRLDHRPQLRRLRPARERRDAGALRGHARHPAPRPLVGDHREVRGHDPLHGAHRHPLVHEARPRRSRKKFDLSSLRLLGSVGEPINPEAWIWYRKIIGGKATPIVDTWWQTETGAIMISALPGVTETEARQRAGAAPRHLDRRRRRRRHARRQRQRRAPRRHRAVAERCCAASGATRSASRRPTGRSSEQGYYFAGDGARLDEDGDIWLLGRVDDVMNVSGHRLSTTEIESALVAQPRPSPRPPWSAHPTRRPARRSSRSSSSSRATSRAHSPDGLAQSLRAWVGEQIGADRASARRLHRRASCPKTRSGKIMRRLLRDVAEGREVGDTTTLADTP